MASLYPLPSLSLLAWLATAGTDAVSRLHAGGRGSPHSQATPALTHQHPFVLFLAKYAKCDQCGNPKVSGFRPHATKASALVGGQGGLCTRGSRSGGCPAGFAVWPKVAWMPQDGSLLPAKPLPRTGVGISLGGWVRERHLAWGRSPGLHPGRGHLAETFPAGLLPCWPAWPQEWCWPQAPELSCAQGNRCVFSLCRGCCKKRASKETADCPGEGACPPPHSRQTGPSAS